VPRERLSFDFFMESHAAQVRVVLAKRELLGAVLLVLLGRVTAHGLALFTGFGAFQSDGDTVCFSCHGRL
jgi:hypothetical protein